MTRCEQCGEDDPDTLVVHHKDRNRKNNRRCNLSILCANCHIKAHKLNRRAKRLRQIEMDKLFNVKRKEVSCDKPQDTNALSLQLRRRLAVGT